MHGRGMMSNVNDGHFRRQGWIPGREVARFALSTPCYLWCHMFVVAFPKTLLQQPLRSRRKHNLWPLRRGRPVAVLEQLQCNWIFCAHVVPYLYMRCVCWIGKGDVRLTSHFLS